MKLLSTLPEPGQPVFIAFSEDSEPVRGVRVIDGAFPAGWYWLSLGFKVAEVDLVKFMYIED